MKPKPNKLPLLIMAAGGLLLAIAAVWLVSGNSPKENDAVTQNLPETDIPRVSIQDAYAAYLTGSAVFLDVRGAESYDAAHIPGALNMPLDKVKARHEELSQDDWILIYCT